MIVEAMKGYRAADLPRTPSRAWSSLRFPFPSPWVTRKWWGCRPSTACGPPSWRRSPSGYSPARAAWSSAWIRPPPP